MPTRTPFPFYTNVELKPIHTSRESWRISGEHSVWSSSPTRISTAVLALHAQVLGVPISRRSVAARNCTSNLKPLSRTIATKSLNSRDDSDTLPFSVHSSRLANPANSKAKIQEFGRSRAFEVLEGNPKSAIPLSEFTDHSFRIHGFPSSTTERHLRQKRISKAKTAIRASLLPGGATVFRFSARFLQNWIAGLVDCLDGLSPGPRSSPPTDLEEFEVTTAPHLIRQL